MYRDSQLDYADKLAEEADRRAIEGVERVRVHGGKPVLVPVDPDNPDGPQRVLVEREYSDLLLMFRLKRIDPEYRDRAPTVQVTQAMQVNQDWQASLSEDKRRDLEMFAALVDRNDAAIQASRPADQRGPSDSGGSG